MTLEEQRVVQSNFTNPLPRGDIIIMVPAGMIEPGYDGLATGSGLGSLGSYSFPSGTNRGNTVEHEIGHAKWSLEHPDMQFSVQDFTNFMNSRPAQIIQWLTKRYQWQDIH